MRTYALEGLVDADRLWVAGGFDGGWRRLRQIAGEHGFIYPPNGSPHDDPRVRHPSQRAIVQQALDETPVALTAIVESSSSWAEVVRRVIHDRDASLDRRAAAEKEWSATKARERVDATRCRLISTRSAHGMQRIGELLP